MQIIVITAINGKPAVYFQDTETGKARKYENGRASAMDYVPPDEIDHWIKMNNAPVPVEKDKTNEEAGKKFIGQQEEKKGEQGKPEVAQAGISAKKALTPTETMTAAGRPRKQKWLERTKKRLKLFQSILEQLPAEAQSKINAIDIKQHTDNVLPSFTESFRQKHGLKDIPIKLKQNILERNNFNHDVIDIREYQMLLGLGLYAPMFFAPGHKPGYLNMVSVLDNDDYPVVLVQLLEEDGYYIIVHFYFIDDKDRKSLLGIP